MNHSARLQGDAKEVSEEAQVDSEEERHHINQDQVRSTEASLGGRQLPEFEVVNVNSNVWRARQSLLESMGRETSAGGGSAPRC
jgi:hypothetical protein